MFGKISQQDNRILLLSTLETTEEAGFIQKVMQFWQFGILLSWRIPQYDVS
jgi:hypothetical protein